MTTYTTEELVRQLRGFTVFTQTGVVPWPEQAADRLAELQAAVGEMTAERDRYMQAYAANHVVLDHVRELNSRTFAPAELQQKIIVLLNENAELRDVVLRDMDLNDAEEKRDEAREEVAELQAENDRLNAALHALTSDEALWLMKVAMEYPNSSLLYISPEDIRVAISSARAHVLGEKS